MSGPLVAEVGGISGWIWSWKNWKSCGEGQESGDKEGERGKKCRKCIGSYRLMYLKGFGGT